MQTWKFLLTLILLLPIASAGRADDKPAPCALQDKAWSATKSGTPEYEEAKRTLQKCLDIASEQKKAEFEATRDTWAASLDKLPNGGWIFLMVSPDGTYGIFGSHRHATREGSVVSLWLRYEYREQQTVNGYSNVKSAVGRGMYDCARVRSKSVSNTYYGESNLGGGRKKFASVEAAARKAAAHVTPSIQ